MSSLFLLFRPFAAGLAALCALSLSAWSASNSSAVAGAPAKTYAEATFKAADTPAWAREVQLPPLDPAVITSVKKSNASSWTKRLDIGVGRDINDLQARGAQWESVEGGLVARWAVVSPEAAALRIELNVGRVPAGVEVRFSGVGDDGTTYGPFTAADLQSAGDSYWSPILTGERAFVEVFVPASVSPSDVDLGIVRLSHLFVHPADPRLMSIAKAGESGSCEIDVICRSPSDAALASTAKSVARMTFTLASGGSALCTGTLLNPIGPQVPYFYSAAHCISTQAAASTLTTHWFFDRVACNSGFLPVLSTVPQVVGGAALIYVNTATDVLLMRLNNNPPAGAVYAAWDSATISGSAALTAIHHPAGDWKKVSLGSFGGLVTPPGTSFGPMIKALWSFTDGVTEGGSSGSGIFTLSGGEYRLRGGLYGGPSSCIANSANLNDYYSRLDLAYSAISQYLSPTVASYALSVSKAGTGSGSVTSSPAGISCGGSCNASFGAGTSVVLSAQPDSGSTFSGWSGACSGTSACTVSMDAAKNVSAAFAINPPPVLAVSTTSLDFGPQLVNTTSFVKLVTVSNTGGGVVMVNAVGVTSGFGLTHDCVLVSAGANCTVRVMLTPTAQTIFTGTLTITTDLGTRTVTLAGRGQGSLVPHYYQTILRRAPDAGGLAFWEAEAVRLSGLGANVNEAWYAMAMSFYSSAEYLALNRNSSGFVTDLYSTFFNRTPDSAGLAYWVGQIDQGLPREMALASFMFSPEFSAITQNLYGNTSARAEVDTVMDFYRGLLSRLADSNGFSYWTQQFRMAQCQGGGAVNLLVEQISAGFTGSAEYAARNRTNTQYVSDLYNAFLRRGGDLGGVQFWVDQLSSLARTRTQLRQSFLSSPEFQARVSAVIAQGCIP